MRGRFFIFLVLGWSSCLTAAVTPTAGIQEAPAYVAPNAPIHVVGPEEADVYAAFLAQAWAKVADHAPLSREAMVLENDSLDQWQPARRAWEQYLLKRVSGQGRAAEDAHQAFLSRPVQVIRFYRFPATELPVHLVRSDILNKALAGGWDAYYDAFPKTQGILSLSAIGFGAQNQEAVFSVYLRCGLRCGYRDLILMRRVNGKWTLIMKDSLP
jgi:hypothetical protein